MKKIIALDLDETLLNSNRILSEHTLKVLKECKKAGYILVISSTRGYGSCKEIADIISADYICCQSGNMIVDNFGNIIYKNGFTKVELAQFLNLAKKYTKNIIVDSDTNLYGGIDDDFCKSWKVIHKDIKDLVDLDVYKICVYYEKDYQKILEDYCKNQNYICRVMRTRPYLLITPSNSDKFYALEKLIERLKTNLDNLFVFGDDNSDLLSIQKAKYGVAVANARQEVLDCSKFITKSNDEDGVACFLESNAIQMKPSPRGRVESKYAKYRPISCFFVGALPVFASTILAEIAILPIEACFLYQRTRSITWERIYSTL